MALYSQTRLGELYKLIQKDNPQYTLPFSTSNVSVTQITALSSGDRNTSAKLTGVRWSGYRNANTVKYNRIDLGELTKNVPVEIRVPGDAGRTLYAVLPYINAQLGIYLEQTDFTDDDLVQSGVSYGTTITMPATHPIYIGSLTFKAVGYIFDLEMMVNERDLGVVTESSPKVTGKTNPSILTYGFDYTAIADTLATFVTDGSVVYLTAAQSKVLAQALSNVDGFPWRSSNSLAEFNLYGSSISYNARPSAASVAGTPAPDLSYDRVLCVNVASNNCSNIAPSSGGWTLMFHYDIIKE